MKLHVLLVLLLIAGIHAPLTHAVKLYKWVDEDGNVTYQDQPPPATASEVEKKYIDPNEGVTEFVPRKPAEPSSDYGENRPDTPSFGSGGGLSTTTKGAIATTDRPFRNERRRGVVPTPPPRPAPAVPPRRPRRAGLPRGGVRIPRR